MGITCKPVGKFRGILQKIQNEEEKEQKAKNLSKGKKKEKIDS